MRCFKTVVFIFLILVFLLVWCYKEDILSYLEDSSSHALLSEDTNSHALLLEDTNSLFLGETSIPSNSSAKNIICTEIYDILTARQDESISSTITSFDSLGYDITAEDVELYAIAISLAENREYKSFRMLEYMGYKVGDTLLSKSADYEKAIALYNERQYNEAFRRFAVLRDYKGKAIEYMCEMLDHKLVSLKVGSKGGAGGYVFYDKGYYSDGWRYLEVAPSDLPKEYIFGYYRSNGSNKIVGTEIGIGTGKSNTEALVKAMGDTAYSSSRTSDTTKKVYAAKACDTYSIEVDGITYDDWFLPSAYELYLMYENLHKNGLGTFKNEFYWSSSECSGSSAWDQNFSNGYQDDDGRNDGYYVRPIRAF